jgi:hypothetical protein
MYSSFQMIAPTLRPQQQLKVGLKIYLSNGRGSQWTCNPRSSLIVEFLVVECSDDLVVLRSTDPKNPREISYSLAPGSSSDTITDSLSQTTPEPPVPMAAATGVPSVDSPVLFELSLREKSRYPFVQLQGNSIQVMFPWVAGQIIGTDNTCQAEHAWKSFFDGGAATNNTPAQPNCLGVINEYINDLEYDIRLLEMNANEVGGPLLQSKQQKLDQLRQYKAIISCVQKGNAYRTELAQARNRSNLYAIQLCPSTIDSVLRFDNATFSLPRPLSNSSPGRSNLLQALNPILNSIIQPQRRAGSANATLQGLADEMARMNLMPNVPKSQADIIRFLDNIRQTAPQYSKYFGYYGNPPSYHVRPLPGLTLNNLFTYISGNFCLDDQDPAEDWIKSILSAFVSEDNLALDASTENYSPFDAVSGADCCIRLQFFLGIISCYLTHHDLLQRNLGGDLLENNDTLRLSLIRGVETALNQGISVEDTLKNHFHQHHQLYAMSRPISDALWQEIVNAFHTSWKAVAGSPHYDEFLVLVPDEHRPFIEFDGNICSSLAHYLLTAKPSYRPTLQQQEFLNQKQREFIEQSSAERLREQPSIQHLSFRIRQSDIMQLLVAASKSRNDLPALANLLARPLPDHRILLDLPEVQTLFTRFRDSTICATEWDGTIFEIYQLMLDSAKNDQMQLGRIKANRPIFNLKSRHSVIRITDKMARELYTALAYHKGINAVEFQSIQSEKKL